MKRLTVEQKLMLADMLSALPLKWWPLPKEIQTLRALERKGFVRTDGHTYELTSQAIRWRDDDERANEVGTEAEGDASP